MRRLSPKQIAEKFLSESKTSMFDDDEAIDILIKKRYRFSPDELNKLKTSEHGNRWTYAHSLAFRGYLFTMDEL